MSSLETPASPAVLYMARGDEVDHFANRPSFTGDVLVDASGSHGLLVQHPCAMRRGPNLVPNLLVSRVTTLSSGVPPDWGTGSFKKSFLPDLMADGQHFAALFDDIELWPSEKASEARRIAVASLYGVNILMQRWVYHNTRVEVPTSRFNDSTNGPFDEADLVGEALTDLELAGQDVENAPARIDAWLDTSGHEGGPSWREQLNDAQHRSSVRRAIRKETSSW